MSKQTVVIETIEEICTLCGGRGHEYSHQSTSGTIPCRQCQGSRYIVTRRVTRTEIPDGKEAQ